MANLSMYSSGLVRLTARYAWWSRGDTIVSKTEQHVRINDSNLAPLQQHTGNRIACQYLPRREKMESRRVCWRAGMQL